MSGLEEGNKTPLAPLKGRGTAMNPGNRFERVHRSEEEELPPDERVRPTTQFLKDSSRSIIAENKSPDVGFGASINPYRGCEHGCIYCYARPTHEYLGFSAGLDFETKILVKEEAPELLRKALASPSWEPQIIALSGVTDPYQPIERKLELTRRCLEVLVEFRNPVFIITKNHLVTRDIDLLKELAAVNAVGVCLSVTTLDADLCGILEPRTSRPVRRLAAIRELSIEGIPTSVNIAPVIPGLTDHEIPGILAAAYEAGARSAGFTPIRLPFAVAELFERWLEAHFPDRKQKVLNRIREMRGGRLNDPDFGSRMRGEGVFADQMRAMFRVASRKAGFEDRQSHLSTDAFRRPPQPGEQLDLFG